MLWRTQGFAFFPTDVPQFQCVDFPTIFRSQAREFTGDILLTTDKQFCKRSLPLRRIGQSAAGECAETAGPDHRHTLQQAAAGADICSDAAVLAEVCGNAQLLGRGRSDQQFHPEPANDEQFQQFPGES
jgi:hypothetical protein